jgi:hypothetical protein
MAEERENRIDPSGKPILNIINTICDDIGPRISGSQQEKQAGEFIYNEMNTFCDSVEMDHFKCRPGGFLDFIWITAILYYLGVITYFIIPVLSPILLILGLVIYSLQQNFLYEVVDFLFKEISTFHVVGKIKPQSPAKKLVLISGHHDSAYEFPLFGKMGEKSAILIIGAVVIVVLNIIIGFVRLTQGIPASPDPFAFLRNLPTVQLTAFLDMSQLLLFIIGLVLITIIAIFLRSNKVVMGANDNLSAVATVIECGRYLASHKPRETEVWLISFAGEEHMRGSKRFVSNHKEEILQREGFLLNLETLSANQLLVATQETMFLAKHSEKVINLVKEAAEQVQVPVKVGPLPFAGSDAANFSRKGLHATTMFGLADTGTPPHWHTLEDTPDKLNGELIAKSGEVALEFVEIIDKM